MNNNGEEVFGELEKIVESDDVAAFKKLVQCHDVTNSLVNQCVDFGATKCLLALVGGYIGEVYPTLEPQIPDGGVTALAYIAHSFPEPRVIDRMLSNCGAICLVNVGCTIGSVHGLPIHFVLIQLSLVNHLYNWTRGQSLIKLVILLCLPDTKPLLDCARLLSLYTNSINDIAWIFLKNGGLKQFTALLLIAREKVVAPFDTGLTIHQYITREIDSVGKDNLNVEQEEYKCMLMDAKTLLDVFEAAGDDLSSYCKSVHNNVSADQVLNDISGLLVKNRIFARPEDFCLRGCIKPYQGLSSSNMSKIWEISERNSLKALPAISSAFHDVISPAMSSRRHQLVPSKPWRPTFVPIPKVACLTSASQPRLYGTRACQARMVNKPLLRASVSRSPRDLAYLTMRFVKGFRFFLTT